MADGLRELRLSRQIPAKDMVEVIQKLYPKYDKTVQSKCENGDAYGVSLRPDALKAVYEAFAPDALEGQERAKRDYHRRTCRISARLDDGLYAKLQQQMEADGYKTAQDLITAMVNQYVAPDAGWISVDDDIPAPDEDVLFILNCGDRPIKSGIRVENGRWWDGSWYDPSEVSHWRRPPQKPKEEHLT